MQTTPSYSSFKTNANNTIFQLSRQPAEIDIWITVVEQELKLDLCEVVWSSSCPQCSALLSQLDLLQCNLQSSFFLGFSVLVDIQTTSAEYNVMWCVFSYSGLGAVQTSSTSLVQLATHPARGELAQAQYQLLTRAWVKVYSDT